MPKKLQFDRAPDDWAKRVKEHIEGRPVERLPDELRGPIIQWLDDARVWDVAGILWKASEDLPEVRKDFHLLMYSTLVGIAFGSLWQPLPNWTKRKYDNISDALKDAAGHPFSLFSPSTKKEIANAVIIFRELGKISPKTRPKEEGLRMALLNTRERFYDIFGKKMDKAVGLLMEVGFGARGTAHKGKGWPEDVVRARAASWRDKAYDRIAK
jgi:hypothetical protein